MLAEIALITEEWIQDHQKYLNPQNLKTRETKPCNCEETKNTFPFVYDEEPIGIQHCMLAIAETKSSVDCQPRMTAASKLRS